MTIPRQLLLLLFAIILPTMAWAQQNDSGRIGSVQGVVRDSVHNYVLQATTVAIYNAQDSSLIAYRLTNNYGEFQLGNLPVDVKLRLITTYAGYKSLVCAFTIASKYPKLDLKNMNMERREIELHEVVIKAPPPIQMNGDTLEFNADAFKLDKNAVTEDLLRKLPGVTIWGDGDITVNGRKVSSVLVNGKPFFGGDTKIATQNLPKNAVDKIQVYQKLKKQDNPLDSTTEVNIKLKKDKSTGYFGKLGAGYGTSKRYETDASLNYFTSQTQFAIVGAANNTNKVANDIGAVMSNSTFKGVGANIEYQPDFSMQGTNKPVEAGFTYQHDFVDAAAHNGSEQMKVDYFIKKNTNTTIQNSQTVTSLVGDSTQTRQNNSSNQFSNTSQDFHARYEKNKNTNYFYTAIGFNASNNYNHYIQESSTSSPWHGLQSNNNQENQGNDDSNSFSFKTGYKHVDDSYQSKLPKSVDIDYSLNVGTDNAQRVSKTDFVSLADQKQNQVNNRQYANNSKDVYQAFNLGGGDFSRFLSFLSNISIKPINNLSLAIHNEDNHVTDKDTLSGDFITNPYLTGSSRYTTINELPSLKFERVFGSGLVNRFSKTVVIDLNVQGQFYYQKNTSSQLFQNITQHYKKFVPTAMVSYRNKQSGDFQDNYNLNFTKSVDYPNINQLVPLVDSANLYYIIRGNRFLKPADKKQISFSMMHISEQTKNDFSYDLNMAAAIVDHSFADSSIVDNQGRSTYTTININGYKYVTAGGSTHKAFKFKNNQLQINFTTSFNISKTPSYINGIKNWSNATGNNSLLTLYYTHQDKVAIHLQEGYAVNSSRQSGANNNLFTYSNQYTKLSASVNCTKKLVIGSNITYNHSTSNTSDAINFTIWNANTTYRFLPDNSLELRLSALDLLHQNTSVVNFSSNNFITRGTVNVLRQYFMATVSYFPRQFGKKVSLPMGDNTSN